jgi:hypothetical protein
MTKLTINSAPSMGLLEVSVYPPDGDPVEFTLSSSLTLKSMLVQSGPYTVVARRPNGTRLRQTAIVGTEDTSISLENSVGPTPNEFMQPESQRGEVASVGSAQQASPGAPLTGTFADILGRAIGIFPPTLGLEVTGLTKFLHPRVPPRELLVLRGWRFDGESWFRLDDVGFSNIGTTQLSSDFLKLSIDQKKFKGGGQSDVLCFGLLGAEGVGPLVMLAPFVGPIELTFVAKGVFAKATDRRATPGQQRVPVALFTPGMHAIADFLSALGSPTTPSAETIWNQAVPHLTRDSNVVDVASALDVLLAKHRWPAEALVAAHYVLRFMPNRLPLEWAKNLASAMSFAADGPVIAAWAWIHNRPSDATDIEVDEAVAQYVSLAVTRPVTLFARTRSLLFEAQHFLPKSSRSDSSWLIEEAYRRAGASAGGLESFWGGAPQSPGATARAEPGPELGRILLDDDKFVRP